MIKYFLFSGLSYIGLLYNFHILILCNMNNMIQMFINRHENENGEKIASLMY